MERLEIILELHGIILSIASLLVMRGRFKNDKVGSTLMVAIGVNILNLLSDVIAVRFAGDTSRLGWFMVRIGNYGLFAAQYTVMAVMARYVYLFIRRKVPGERDKWLKTIYIITGVVVAGFLLNPFTHCYFYFDEFNEYHRSPLIMACFVLCVFNLVIMFAQMFIHHDELDHYERTTLWGFFALPVVGLIIQIIFFGYSFMNLGITVSILFNAIQEVMYNYRRRQEERIRLEQNKAYLLNSQIRPHFMFNALAVIQSLIMEDPATASEAITYLASYLRKDMNLKNSESTVPLEEELEYVKDYLYIEKLRFGEKVQYEIHVEDGLNFGIPFLTIQPLVENAVRHGIRKKVEGGTVWVEIFEAGKNYVIEVADDGVGFEPEKVLKNVSKSDDRTMKAKPFSELNNLANVPETPSESNGIALENVRQRLKVMCNGSLEITSSPGNGTKVVVKIPRKRGE